MASWKETSEGRFERPFDSIETFFLNLARGTTAPDREHWSVSIFAKFEMKGSIEDTGAALRQAWVTMRHDHPEIACIAQGGNKVYEVPDEAALDTWISSTFFIAPASMTKEVLLSSFRPSALATLHYLPRNSEIVIHTSHWRIDLFGALGLLNNLFTVLNEPRHVRFGEEGRRLSPGRDEVAGFNCPEIVDSPTAVQENATAGKELAMQLLGNLPSIGFLMKTPLPKPAGTSRSEIILESSTTATVISAIKARGLSVTTALHAALIVALQQLTSVPPSSSYRYTTYGIFNIRPFLEPPHNDPFVNPATLQMIGLPLTLNTVTYQTLVTELKPYYKQRLPPATDSVIPKQIVCPYTKFMAQVVGSPPPSDHPPLAEPMFNSVGIVDGYLSCKYGDSIKIQDFWVGVEMLTPQVECYVWTWQGKMTLSAMYNDAFYESEFIHGFLRRILDVLFAELNIQED